ncbi:MAG: SH3 domain-containing protein [Lachnospiraceae bacterium]|nr:SH3 domain-containing protein [Lachnospiraceae bacterium]
MKKTRKNQMLKGVLMALVFTFGVFVWCSDSVVTLAAGTAKVVANSGNIREDADADSKVLASVKKDAMMDVIASKTDSDGYTWYKVWVNSQQTGYIRSDLVTVNGTISAETTTNNTTNDGGNKTVVGSNNSTETPATEVAVVNVSATDVATAKATADVRVRKGAGTNFEVAGQAKNGTEVTVTGVAADGEGKNWYQISFNENNKTVNGFIREDYLEVLSRVEPEVEEPVAEEPAVEEPVIENQDYYLKYMQNDQGEMDWFLFDNIQGTSQSLTKLLDAVEQMKDNELVEAKQISNMRLIVIALVVVAGILIIVITVLIFKLRDAYEYECEDDEEEYEDEEADEDDGDNEEDDGYVEEYEEERVVRKPFFGFGKKKEVVEEAEDEDEEEETLEEIQPIQPSKTVKKETQAWQSKDFLELDDDMEFEFLDLGK